MVGVYDNLIVLGGNNDRGSTLIVYRAEDGRQLINQSYGGFPQRRLNTLTVNPEGYLAAVHSDSIDLFDLGSGATAPIASLQGPNPAAFAGTRTQDQVQFCADKLLVMVVEDRPQVRMFDAMTLQPVRITDRKTQQQVERQIMPVYQEGMREGDVARMYVQKDRLLLRAGRDFMVYLVPTPDATPWQRPREPAPARSAMSSQSPLFVRDGVLIFDWPQNLVGQPIASPRVQYFRRELLESGREAGTLLGEFNLSRGNAKMLDRVQPVDGGIYTVWTDGTLAFYPSRKE
jgi:hypothetical protein